MSRLPPETTIYSLSALPPQPERREDGERHLTLFRVGVLIVDGQRDLCLIKNISAGGMRIRAYSPVVAGALATVDMKGEAPLTGRIIWTEGKSAGIEFDRRIDVIEMLSHSAGSPRPRMPRIETDVILTIRDGGDLHRVAACDISQGGMKVRVETGLTEEAEVVVCLPGLDARLGVVRWSRGGLAGIRFNRLLPLTDLTDWLRDQRSEARRAG